MQLARFIGFMGVALFAGATGMTMGACGGDAESTTAGGPDQPKGGGDQTHADAPDEEEKAEPIPIDTTPAADGLIELPPGTFEMGAAPEEQCRREEGDNITKETFHTVTLTRGFAIAPTEVTQRHFEEVMGYNPARHVKECGPECPVEDLTWHEAAAFCNALSDKAELTPCYSCQGSGRDVQCVVASVFLAGDRTIYHCRGYRLPTEAEWEYAYRAGTTTAYYAGPDAVSQCDESPLVDTIGWYRRSSYVGGKSQPQPVAAKEPNAWALYDMAGNVQEMVNDTYALDLGSAPAIDPVGARSNEHDNIVSRGGDFANPAFWLRAAFRMTAGRAKKYTGVGFRYARAALPGASPSPE